MSSGIYNVAGNAPRQAFGFGWYDARPTCDVYNSWYAAPSASDSLDLSLATMSHPFESAPAAQKSARPGDDVSGQEYHWADNSVDVVVGNLVLEHVEDLVPIYVEAARVLRSNGQLYFGELHPFRQLKGGQAHFTEQSSNEIVHIFDERRANSSY